MSRYWYRFSYHAPRERGREPQPHQLRDGDAALFLSPILRDRGYSYGGPIFNYPLASHDTPAVAEEVDATFLRPGDLIVLTTRPPLDDAYDRDRRPPMRSGTTLEERIFAKLRHHFDKCSRSQVIVAEAHARAWPAVAPRRNMEFPVYRRHHTHTTACYMTFDRHAWDGGPGLMSVFGMSGTDTLVWAHLLHARYSELVAKAPFVMALLSAAVPPSQPLSMSFATEWGVSILTEPPPRTRRS